MNTLEIVCESCESRMRLSETLLQKIQGKTGRVTCKQCKTKIVLDATSGEVVVKDGGSLVDDLELEKVTDFSELPPTADPHLSELPQDRAPESLPEDEIVSERNVGEVSLPPPLPEELKLRRSMNRAKQPNLNELAAAVSFAQDPEEFEAPVPPMRGEEDSLSPHSIGDDGDEEDMIKLGREFNSSPFASERDESFNSLYPTQKKSAQAEAPAPQVSMAPPAPKAGELHRGKQDSDLFEDSIAAAPAVAATAVELGDDGELINKTDKKAAKKEARSRTGSWVPWALAAVALLALGVSLAQDRETTVVVQAPAKAPSAVAAPAKVDAAEKSDEAEVEEPAEAKADAAEENAGSASTVPNVAPTRKGNKTESSSPAPAQADGTQANGAQAEAEAASGKAAEATDEKPSEEGAAEEPQRDLPPFSSSAASVAMRESTALAGTCRKPGDPTGYAKVVVTFAPSGRVTRASVSGPPYAGTQTGGCIASRFRSARVPAFSGDHVTVTKTVSIR